MADEIRSGDSKVRVVRLLGHRDDAGAWEIRDFLKRRSVPSCRHGRERGPAIAYRVIALVLGRSVIGRLSPPSTKIIPL